MNKIKISIFVVGAILLLAQLVPLVTASHYEDCEDFSEEKQEDCEYIIDLDLDEEYEQEFLDLLLDNSDNEYEWETPEFNEIGLRLLTDKFTYKAGDTIKVEIFPKNTIVTLDYAGKTTQGVNAADLIAYSQYNKVKVRYGEETYEKLISVVETNRLILAWRIFIFGLFNYFALSLTKYSVIIKWLRAV